MSTTSDQTSSSFSIQVCQGPYTTFVSRNVDMKEQAIRLEQATRSWPCPFSSAGRARVFAVGRSRSGLSFDIGMTFLIAMQFTTSIWQQPITCYLERPALDLNDIRSQRSTDAQAPCPPGSQRHVQRRPAPRVLDRPSRSGFPYQVVHLPVRSCRYCIRNIIQYQ